MERLPWGHTHRAPVVQTLAPPVAHAGIMQGVMAFTQAQALPGGECIKDGVDMLKASMAGTFPTDAQLAEINAKLA